MLSVNAVLSGGSAKGVALSRMAFVNGLTLALVNLLTRLRERLRHRVGMFRST